MNEPLAHPTHRIGNQPEAPAKDTSLALSRFGLCIGRAGVNKSL
jgi:hypothetical protein